MDNVARNVSPEMAAIEVTSKVGLDGDDLVVALLEQSDDCIKILDVEGRLQFMNCGGQRAMEIDDPAMVMGKLWWDLWPADSRNLLYNVFNSALSGHAPNFEADCPTAKGTPRRWMVSLKPMTAADGRVASVLATSRDVTKAA